jgi:hypothetical protein
MLEISFTNFKYLFCLQNIKTTFIYLVIVFYVLDIYRNILQLKLTKRLLMDLQNI